MFVHQSVILEFFRTFIALPFIPECFCMRQYASLFFRWIQSYNYNGAYWNWVCIFFELFTLTRYAFRYITTVTNVYMEARIHNILLLFIMVREVLLLIKKPRQDADLGGQKYC